MSPAKSTVLVRQNIRKAATRTDKIVVALSPMRKLGQNRADDCKEPNVQNAATCTNGSCQENVLPDLATGQGPCLVDEMNGE